MKVYRASRRPAEMFDPLDAAPSVSSALGWRYNDALTPILYAAEVEALAVLEVAIRPGLEDIDQIVIAEIDIPANSVVDLADVAIVLPSNWNARPAAPDSRAIARKFLDAIAKVPAKKRPCGLRVPSVLSRTDYTILLDPSRTHLYRATKTHTLPFRTFTAAGT